MEQGVVCSEQFVPYRLDRQTVHRDLGFVDQARQHGMDAKLRHSQLEFQLCNELFGKQIHELDLSRSFLLHLHAPSVLQIFLDADGEPPCHLVPLQVLFEIPKEHRLFRVHAAQLPQGARDAANHVREANQRKNHYHKTESAFALVLRLYIHRCWGKLSY